MDIKDRIKNLKIPGNIEPVPEEMMLQLKRLNERMGAIEQHLINLIIPLENISTMIHQPTLSEAIKLFSKPIKIDDSQFLKVCQDVIVHFKSMYEGISSLDIGQTHEKMSEIKSSICMMEHSIARWDKGKVKVQVNLMQDGDELEITGPSGRVKRVKKEEPANKKRGRPLKRK